MSQDNAHARFAEDWLNLREPLDHAARAAQLNAAAARWLARADGPYTVVDLGSGRGSNLRYLAPRLPGAQAWRLLDHDPALLEQACRTTDTLIDSTGHPVAVTTQTIDLNGPALEPALAGAQLVTAAALFDLVTAKWIERLAAACAREHAAVLFVLSVDGTIDFAPADTDDDFVTTLIRAHQQRDKSFGAALGTAAPAVLARCFRAHGYQVQTGESVWRIDAGAQALGCALIAGWRDAASEQSPKDQTRITAWADRRQQALRAGSLAITVGHCDLFAAPGGT